MKTLLTTFLSCLPLLLFGQGVTFSSITRTNTLVDTNLFLTTTPVAGGTRTIYFSDVRIAISTNISRLTIPPVAITPSGTNATVDFSLASMRTLALTTNCLFAASNLSAGTRVTIRITPDATTRLLFFPASWIPIGAPVPGSIAASKIAELELVSWGTADANVTVKYAEQP